MGYFGIVFSANSLPRMQVVQVDPQPSGVMREPHMGANGSVRQAGLADNFANRNPRIATVVIQVFAYCVQHQFGCWRQF
jgi:hypothetical protein